MPTLFSGINFHTDPKLRYSIRRRSGGTKPNLILGLGKSALSDASGENAQTNQICREGSDGRRQCGVACVRPPEPDQPESVVYAEVVRKAAAEKLPEGKASAWLAAGDRLSVPQVHSRDSPADRGRGG